MADLTLLEDVRQEPIPDVVAIAERMAVDARAGTLRAVVAVMIYDGGVRSMARYVEPEHLPAAYWGLTMVGQEMIQHGLDESEHGDVADLMPGEE